MNCRFLFLKISLLVLINLQHSYSNAAVYSVNTKAALQTKMSAAIPGDTVVVANGTYNWGQISFTNKNGTASSSWIVLKAQSLSGVIFTTSTYLQFGGKHILIDGFKFFNGNVGKNDVISFKSAGGTNANYCRITNITIQNYNSDTTGAYMNTGTGNGLDTLNKWVSMYGTNNRVDHCSFINKYNGDPTVVIWYDSTNYPAKGTSTFHLIDSNYFKYRGYLGANEGEVIRVGTSVNSRTNGYNIVEYNLFEDGSQIDPEIISNKSNFNTYRYNTFRNHAGGITLREGRYCNVYGNFFLRTNSSLKNQYGIRVIDKGHKIFNNYIENLIGNNNSISSLRCPIILYNGVTNSNDTNNPIYAAKYFAADSCLVAFNTIVNCSGGAGLVIGYGPDSSIPFQPKGIVIANNLIKMTKGQAAFLDTTLGKQVTYFAEGNMFNAPNGLGLLSSTGFTTKTLSFGTRTNGILPPPSLVKDAAINTNNYTTFLNGIDVRGVQRTTIYDVGAYELNGTGPVINFPLDSTMVGVGTSTTLLPVSLQDFSAKAIYNENEAQALLQWKATNEINLLGYYIECSSDGFSFETIGFNKAENASSYQFNYLLAKGVKKYYFRLKCVDQNGQYSYSKIIYLALQPSNSLFIYPNPAKDYLNISLLETPINGKLIIFDNQGIAVKQFTISNLRSKFFISSLLTGSYYLQYSNNNKILGNYPFEVVK